MGHGDFPFHPASALQESSLGQLTGRECPVCRHGTVEAMVLMETLACGFCRHIFEINPAQQTIHVVDSAQPMGWRWQGRRWQPLHQGRGDVALTLWIIGLTLVILPAGMVALGGYLFPPLEDAAHRHWSLVWAGLTGVAHSAMVTWLVVEYYQFPTYVLLKIRLRRWLEALSTQD